MRRRLVAYGVAITSVVLVAFGVPMGLLVRNLAEGQALGLAEQQAQSVAVVAAVADDARLVAVVDSVNAGSPRRTTVFLPDGRAVGDPAPVTDGVRLARTGRALSAAVDGGVEVLLPVAGPSGRAVVRTFLPDAVLARGVPAALGLLAGLGTLLLGAAALAAWRIAARISASVDDVAAVAHRLAEGDLAARAVPAGPPEVAAVAGVLNRLAARIVELLAAERELVADLSHRLRTPITALRLDADGLRDPEEAARLGAHVDALQGAVTGLIETARRSARTGTGAGSAAGAGTGPGPDAGPRCDAAAVVRDRAAFWAVLAEDQHRPLRVDLPAGTAPVAVGADDLAAAVDALVGNVFAHTPEGAALDLAVRVRAGPGGSAAGSGRAPGAGPGPGAAAPRPAPGTVEVVVADAGPGFEAAALARGTSGAGSTGLGLDIARRTAAAAGGSLEVGRPAAGGAEVVLRMPIAG